MPSTKALFTAAAICFLVALAVPTAAITVGEDPASDDVVLSPVDDRYASIENGELKLDISAYDHAKTTMSDVFTIEVGAGATDLEVIWIDHDVDGVAFYEDGDEITPDSQLEPEPGDTVTVGMTIDTTVATAGMETFTIHVAYADDDDDRNADVGLGEVDYSASEFEVGETLRVNATYSNDGDRGGLQVAELVVDGIVVDRQTVYVGPGESKTVSFERTMDRSGTFEIGVDDRDAQTVTVRQPAGPAPDLQVTATELESGTVAPGESVVVTATVANAGNVTGTMTVEFAVGGVVVDTRTVELEPGEETTVTFEHRLDESGEYSLSVNGVAVGGESGGTVTVGNGDEITVFNRSFSSSSAAAAAPAAGLGLLFTVTGIRRHKNL